MQCTSNKYEMILKLLENKGPINGSGKKACKKKNERNNLKSSTCTSDISSIQFDQTRQKNLNKRY